MWAKQISDTLQRDGTVSFNLTGQQYNIQYKMSVADSQNPQYPLERQNNFLYVVKKISVFFSKIIRYKQISLLEKFSVNLISKFLTHNNNNNIIYLLNAIGLLPGGSGYFTCKHNMKLVITRFQSGELHEKHVVATWNVGNHLIICL